MNTYSPNHTNASKKLNSKIKSILSHSLFKNYISTSIQLYPFETDSLIGFQLLTIFCSFLSYLKKTRLKKVELNVLLLHGCIYLVRQIKIGKNKFLENIFKAIFDTLGFFKEEILSKAQAVLEIKVRKTCRNVENKLKNSDDHLN